ncbi:hypothetical protein PPNSA23_42100 [Phyllobacterium phragmitis]|uniref:Uncharacterized protein n=1 Tax=Phyllobacterium phragmitis TaxID=2670329 RepID=A0ABQ0H5U3_9HYPH
MTHLVYLHTRFPVHQFLNPKGACYQLGLRQGVKFGMPAIESGPYAVDEQPAFLAVAQFIAVMRQNPPKLGEPGC